MVEGQHDRPTASRARICKHREDRLRTFLEGHRYDPNTHQLYATRMQDGPEDDGGPREAISIVPLGLSPAEVNAGIPRGRGIKWPTWVVPRELDAIALLEADSEEAS